MNTPLYRQLSENLKNQIVSGQFLIGERLPSENQLCLQHQINRATVRQALKVLEDEGYIQKHHGKGSIVIDRKKSLGLLSIKGFSDVVRGKRQKVNNIMLIKPSLKSWPEPFIYSLPDHISDDLCIFMKRLRCVDNVPVMLEKTYMPSGPLPRFSKIRFINDSLFDTLQVHYQISVEAVEQDIKAVLADDNITNYLPIENGTPVLQIILKFFTSKLDFNIYSTLYCDTSTYSIGNIINE